MGSLDSVISNLKKMKSVSAVILFGSQARGTSRKDSDTDLCIITKNGDDTPLEFSSEEFDISIFSKLPITVRHRVLKDGKVLFSKDDKVLSRIRFWTNKIYLDEKHWRDRFTEKVLSC